MMPRGTKHSEETKRKISKTLKGRKLSLKTKRKISEALKGKRGRKHSLETRKRISESNKGKKHSKKVRKKMSEAHLGMKKPWVRSSPQIFKKGSNKGNKNVNWKDGRMKNKKYVSWSKNKRNRMKRTNGGFHTFEEWQLLKAQYNWMCLACKKPEPKIQLTEDHIIPISMGGSDNIENIQPLCRSCNAKKYTKLINF